MNQLYAPVTYRFGGISVLTLLILCALAVGLMGCDGPDHLGSAGPSVRSHDHHRINPIRCRFCFYEGQEERRTCSWCSTQRSRSCGMEIGSKLSSVA